MEKLWIGKFFEWVSKSNKSRYYKELVEETYFRGKESIPLFTTAFADVITCDANKFIGMIKHKTLDVNAVWEGMDNFFELLGN